MNNELRKYLWNTYEFKKYAKLGRQSRNLFSIFKQRSFSNFWPEDKKKFSEDIWAPRYLVSRDFPALQNSEIVPTLIHNEKSSLI